MITETVPHVRSVSIGVWIGTGARRETCQNGISHFIEHMLFKGTRNRTAEEIAREADSTGGNLDAYTAKELVSYNIKVLDEHMLARVRPLADLVLNPRFDPEDIEKEKGVILEELKMEVDNPEYLVHETFFSKFWKNHPLGRSILGTKTTIASFDNEMIRRITPMSMLLEHRNHRGWSPDPQPNRRIRVAVFRTLARGRATAGRSGPGDATPANSQKQALSRAGASLHGSAGVSDCGRAPLWNVCTQHDSGRRHEFAAVSKRPREARTGVFGVLGIESVPRFGLSGRLCGDVAGELKKMILMVIDEFRQIATRPFRLRNFAAQRIT